jgi:hypothetical protein
MYEDQHTYYSMAVQVRDTRFVVMTLFITLCNCR